MTYFRLLNIQSITGLVVSVCLALLLVIQKGETRHWKKQAGQLEQLYHDEQAAHAGTVANYRAAAEAARAADKAAAERVAAEQAAINQRSNHDLQTRLADARATAERLRQLAQGPANSGSGPGARLSGLPAARGGPAQAAGQDGLPVSEALIATEQAIQLDELIKWVQRQHSVDPNAGPPASH
jgi:uncharacterized membrane protein YqiK